GRAPQELSAGVHRHCRGRNPRRLHLPGSGRPEMGHRHHHRNTEGETMIHPDIPKSEQVMAFTHLGYDCTVLMVPFTINGYIVLPEGHPWLQHDSLEDVDFIDVHGGVTYHRGRVIGFDT